MRSQIEIERVLQESSCSARQKNWAQQPARAALNLAASDNEEAVQQAQMNLKFKPRQIGNSHFARCQFEKSTWSISMM
ncbi:uncharacterized protein BT62DRAFT_450 [Guyanagaster necrorhizus]|uniref:Uncharacterized protein n=1 Tax=Guyanagaster necrorhizus TaxID=856835 RepID=A0A9P8AYA0_9AGAR|nr:uncharacterized protein BT62DRAFT_450 [Guyanagaster necrorhizus MCA 3950]KAG7452433.1 hypothetical protein BT62DRAFT_450 [Guyanagaster necrorhizus MCA 3950]